MTKSASVPHHRVDATLHAKARKLSTKENASLSQVAETGLQRYIEQHPLVSSAKNTTNAPTLPNHVINVLADMKASGDQDLDSALAALHLAGWSYATLAAPINLTRQAVHLRVSKVAAGWPLTSDIPQGPSRGSSSASSSQNHRFDWAIWVDKSIYEEAAKTAKHRGDLMRNVMESILSDYVSGAFAVNAADVSPAESNEKKAKTR